MSSLALFRRRLRAERGVAAVELALMLPVVVFLVMTAVPSVAAVIAYVDLSEASEAGARYATAAHLDPENPTVYRFRPDAAGVAAYLRRISEVSLDSVSVTPDPSNALPGTEVTITLTHHVSFGPLARVANALAGLVHADPPFPDGGVVLTSTATMREE
jgi:Flp pilus assembly protein TadG